MTDETKDREHLKDLLDLESGLTPWEVEFIDSLDGWRGPFTTKQSELIYKIYEKRC